MRNQAGRWYFGWNIVAASALLTLLTVGMRMSIGPFFLPMAADTGLSRTQLSGIVALGMLLYGLAMPVAAWLVNMRGTRFVLLSGTAMVVMAAIWTAQARSVTGLLLSFGVLLSIGLAFTGPVAVTPIISRWFEARRGMALLFLSAGSMGGMALLTPVLTAAIAHWGWRATLLGFGLAFTLLVVPVSLWVMRDDAPEDGDAPPGRVGKSRRPAPWAHLSTWQAVCTRPFLLVAFGLFVCGFSMNLLGTHGVPMLMDHGFDADTSALGIGVIGATAIVGTLVLGRLADRLPRKLLLAAIYFVRGLGFFALVAVGTQPQLMATSVIGGLVWAGSIALSSAILADLYGVRLVGVLYGLGYVGHQIGGTFSAWLGGWAVDHAGTHWLAFGAAGTLLLLGAFAVCRLPGPLWSLAPAQEPAPAPAFVSSSSSKGQP